MPTVRQLAEQVRGEVAGNPDLEITAARPLADAGPGDLTFVESDKHLSAWHDSPAAAAVVRGNVPLNGRPLIRVADPLAAFVCIVKQLRGIADDRTEPGVDPTAAVRPSATVAASASVGPFCAVGDHTVIGAGTRLGARVTVGRDCRIGANCVLHPGVVLYDGCVLGDRVTVHANAVLGADGFGYRTANGAHQKVPQLGWVEIGDDVEIGANTTIDRGTFGPTTVGVGTKIDNLVMVAHNCRIGRHNLIVAQVGLAGSTTTGDYVVLAGQVGVGGHVTIGDRAVVGAQSGVAQDVPADVRVLGSPPLPDRDQLRVLHTLPKLPDLRRDVKRILKHLGLEGGA